MVATHLISGTMDYFLLALGIIDFRWKSTNILNCQQQYTTAALGEGKVIFLLLSSFFTTYCQAARRYRIGYVCALQVILSLWDWWEEVCNSNSTSYMPWNPPKCFILLSIYHKTYSHNKLLRDYPQHFSHFVKFSQDNLKSFPFKIKTQNVTAI